MSPLCSVGCTSSKAAGVAAPTETPGDSRPKVTPKPAPVVAAPMPSSTSVAEPVPVSAPAPVPAPPVSVPAVPVTATPPAAPLVTGPPPPPSPPSPPSAMERHVQAVAERKRQKVLCSPTPAAPSDVTHPSLAEWACCTNAYRTICFLRALFGCSLPSLCQDVRVCPCVRVIC